MGQGGGGAESSPNEHFLEEREEDGCVGPADASLFHWPGFFSALLGELCPGLT